MDTSRFVNLSLNVFHLCYIVYYLTCILSNLKELFHVQEVSHRLNSLTNSEFQCVNLLYYTRTFHVINVSIELTRSL